jgi:hypothetical protein
MTEQFQGVCIKNHFTGILQVTAVAIGGVRLRSGGFKDDVRHPPNYLIASIARSECVVDDIASGLKRTRRNECDYCLSGIIDAYDRIVFSCRESEAYDIMIIRGLPGAILVSQKFADLLEETGAGGVRLTPTQLARSRY